MQLAGGRGHAALRPASTFAGRAAATAPVALSRQQCGRDSRLRRRLGQLGGQRGGVECTASADATCSSRHNQRGRRRDASMQLLGERYGSAGCAAAVANISSAAARMQQLRSAYGSALHVDGLRMQCVRAECRVLLRRVCVSFDA